MNLMHNTKLILLKTHINMPMNTYSGNNFFIDKSSICLLTCMMQPRIYIIFYLLILLFNFTLWFCNTFSVFISLSPSCTMGNWGQIVYLCTMVIKSTYFWSGKVINTITNKTIKDLFRPIDDYIPFMSIFLHFFKFPLNVYIKNNSIKNQLKLS